MPGTGRRRRADSPEDTGGFAVIRPQELNVPPQAHPEHREHAAWGAGGGWSAPGPGPGSRGGAVAEDWPLDSEPVEWTRFETGASVPPRRPQPQPSGGRLPHPRQEYVDAFDAPLPPRPRPAAPREPAEPGLLVQPEPSAGKADKSGGKGRTLTAIAAAAVVTVLAVVVGGQLLGGEKDHTDKPAPDATPRSAADETASAPSAPSTAAAPSVTPTLAPASYDQLMDRQYPLDPKLALSGAFTTVPGHQAAPGRGKVLRFRVDVEKGLPLDAGLFAQTVFKTLNDRRSWGHGGTMTFERVSSGPADIVVTLASPGTTAKWCEKSGLDTTVDNVSCDAASTPRTMINAYRWAQGADTFGPQRMHEYRQMLINHEVGHRLGHGHVGCPKAGAPAPVMMQQTKYLSLDGGPTCKPNAWPFP
ncbi:DUF3152 domain-containing protein [Streptomyces sp. NBC_01476]|uniref:DUF3152 domain-containing protein n=1 Tax=Streptomyces sp. NBC_01476 TaxID=2903881 RepID=UPI002E30D7B7|nr:DUF3152 domain-containing protein [Streptomyces sp. NBC_01476]